MQENNRRDAWRYVGTAVLTMDAQVIEVAGNPAGHGAVLVELNDISYTFDLVAARRFARVLLQAAEHADGGGE